MNSNSGSEESPITESRAFTSTPNVELAVPSSSSARPPKRRRHRNRRRRQRAPGDAERAAKRGRRQRATNHNDDQEAKERERWNPPPGDTLYIGSVGRILWKGTNGLCRAEFREEAWNERPLAGFSKMIGKSIALPRRDTIKRRESKRMQKRRDGEYFSEDDDNDGDGDGDGDDNDVIDGDGRRPRKYIRNEADLAADDLVDDRRACGNSSLADFQLPTLLGRFGSTCGFIRYVLHADERGRVTRIIRAKYLLDYESDGFTPIPPTREQAAKRATKLGLFRFAEKQRARYRYFTKPLKRAGCSTSHTRVTSVHTGSIHTGPAKHFFDNLHFIGSEFDILCRCVFGPKTMTAVASDIENSDLFLNNPLYALFVLANEQISSASSSSHSYYSALPTLTSPNTEGEGEEHLAYAHEVLSLLFFGSNGGAVTRIAGVNERSHMCRAMLKDRDAALIVRTDRALRIFMRLLRTRQRYSNSMLSLRDGTFDESALNLLLIKFNAAQELEFRDFHSGGGGNSSTEGGGGAQYKYITLRNDNVYEDAVFHKLHALSNSATTAAVVEVDGDDDEEDWSMQLYELAKRIESTPLMVIDARFTHDEELAKIMQERHLSARVAMFNARRCSGGGGSSAMNGVASDFGGCIREGRFAQIGSRNARLVIVFGAEQLSIQDLHRLFDMFQNMTHLTLIGDAQLMRSTVRVSTQVGQPFIDLVKAFRRKKRELDRAQTYRGTGGASAENRTAAEIIDDEIDERRNRRARLALLDTLCDKVTLHDTVPSHLFQHWLSSNVDVMSVPSEVDPRTLMFASTTEITRIIEECSSTAGRVSPSAAAATTTDGMGRSPSPRLMRGASFQCFARTQGEVNKIHTTLNRAYNQFSVGDIVYVSKHTWHGESIEESLSDKYTFIREGVLGRIEDFYFTFLPHVTASARSHAKPDTLKRIGDTMRDRSPANDDDDDDFYPINYQRVKQEIQEIISNRGFANAGNSAATNSNNNTIRTPVPHQLQLVLKVKALDSGAMDRHDMGIVPRRAGLSYTFRLDGNAKWTLRHALASTTRSYTVRTSTQVDTVGIWIGNYTTWHDIYCAMLRTRKRFIVFCDDERKLKDALKRYDSGSTTLFRKLVSQYM